MTIRVVDASVCVGSSDITQWTGSITETPGTTTVDDITTFGYGGFRRRAAGLKSGTLNLAGFTDHATGGVANLLTTADLGATTGYSVVIPTGAALAAADSVLFGSGVISKFAPLMSPLDKAAGFALELNTNAGFVANGRCLAPLASYTTAGLTGTAVAMVGPTAAQYVRAILHVTAAAGTNLVVKVQSDDNSGFTSATDRITFSTVSAIGYQVATLVGNLSTETYWRAVATIATSTFTFAVHVGVS